MALKSMKVHGRLGYYCTQQKGYFLTCLLLQIYKTECVIQQEDVGISIRSQRAQSVSVIPIGIAGPKESLFPNITCLAYAVVSVLRPVG